jgi:SAM-dependent methyltransferase
MIMSADIWKERDVASAFLDERSSLIPDPPRQLEVLQRVIRCFCPEPRLILDLGTGDAILMATLLESFPDARGVAIDFSPPMLEQAQHRLERFGERAAIREADLRNPSWRESSSAPFDVVVSGFAIHHLSDERKRALYREIHQSLNAGGVFLNCEHVASATPNVERMFEDVMMDHLYERRRARGEDVPPEQLRREFLERPDREAKILALVEDQCGWLREIGFRDVDCFWKYFELALFGGRK